MQFGEMNHLFQQRTVHTENKTKIKKSFFFLILYIYIFYIYLYIYINKLYLLIFIKKKKCMKKLNENKKLHYQFR